MNTIDDYYLNYYVDLHLEHIHKVERNEKKRMFRMKYKIIIGKALKKTVQNETN